MEDALGNPSLVVLFGIVSLLVTSLMKRADWPSWGKQLLALGVALVFGLVAVALRVEGEGTDWTLAVVIGHISAVAVVAQLLYLLLINGSRGRGSPLVIVNEWLTAIGSKPAPTPTDAPEVKPPPGGISTQPPTT